MVHRCWELLDQQFSDDDSQAAETLEVLSRLRHIRSALDARGLLEKPEMLVFVDGRRLAERFELISNNLIRRDGTTQRALAEAGVRAAEELIETVVDPDIASTPADELRALVVERTPAIVRLVEAHRDEELAYDVARLDSIEFLAVPDLVIEHRVRFAHRVQQTDPQPADAAYLDDSHQLLVRAQTPNRHLARELARCIEPAADVSAIASSLHEVLSASTLDEAMEVLNEYGVRDLDESKWHHVATQVSEEGNDDGDAGSHRTPDGQTPPLDAKPDSDHQHLENGTSESVDTQGDATRGSRRTTRSTSRRGSGQRRTQMASLVWFDDDDRRLDDSGDEAPDRSTVDAAGVRRVLRYEESCGRVPKEQAHNNPGFDVLSCDAEGNALRRIEIKSIGGAWTGFGVWMSATQLAENRTHGADFWLYVVEHAEDDDAAVIHRIQDPASQATKFGFDAGWQALSEPELDRDDSGRPLVVSTRRLLGWGKGTLGDDVE